jgi:hypothetical protein
VVDLALVSRSGIGSSLTEPKLSLESRLVADGRLGRIALGAEAIRSDRGLHLGALDAAVSLMPRRAGSMQGELAIWALSDDVLGARNAGIVGMQARAHLQGRWIGAWAGMGARSFFVEDGVVISGAPTLGAWLRGRGLAVNVAVSRLRAPVARPMRPQTVGGFPDTLRRIAERPLSGGTEAVVGAQWSSGRLELTGEGGAWLPRGDARERWLSAGATIWVTPSVGIVAGARETSMSAHSPLRSERTASLGLRLATIRMPTRVLPVAVAAGALAFAVTVRGTDATFEIRAPGAHSVLLRGDITEWSAVALTRRDADRWLLTLPISSGVHHVMISVDGGEWTPPPGVPTASDGFGGSVGIIVVNR